MIKAWRIAQTKYAQSAEAMMSGEGARLYGGRWNSTGIPMVYCASSLSLAILEILVHLQDSRQVPNYSSMEIEINEDLVLDFPREQFDKFSNNRPFLTSIGDSWVKDGNSVVLQVPSKVVPNEKNYLINPAHEDFSKLKLGEIASLTIDDRLLPRSI